MSAKSSFILKTMNVIFWIIFIGLCVQTGSILTTFLISLFIDSEDVHKLYMELDFTELHQFSTTQYVRVVSLIIIINGFKAYIAYLVVRIFLILDFSKPFNPEITSLISKISHVALGAGLLAIVANAFSDWLIKRGIPVEYDWGSGEILFFAGVIYIIAQIFKKGTEIQTENELTV